MGRPSKTRSLSLWMNGEHVGWWQLGRSGQQLTYSAEWFRSKAFRPLSLSLPATEVHPVLKDERVAAFFDNLLPDSDRIRARLQSRFKTASREAFDLLSAIGRDCAGAIQLLPDDEAPIGWNKIEGEPLNEAQVERLLAHVTLPGSGPLRVGEEDADNLRISIAGAQEKTALLWHKDQWHRPLNATPTTHILKLPLGFVGARQADMSTSVENEWLCSKILAAYGLPVASCDVATFGKQKVLVVKRFDRKLTANRKHWLRIPQEDFCQATGTPSELKYQSDGGPGLLRISRLLAQSTDPDNDLKQFFKAQILFWALAATDGHAKNFSVFLAPGGAFRMTHFYDVMSVWPIVGDGPHKIPPRRVKLAMGWLGNNLHYNVATVTRKHFNATALKCGLGTNAEPLIGELLEATPGVVEVVTGQIPRGFPERLAEAILGGLQRSMQRLEAMSLG